MGWQLSAYVLALVCSASVATGLGLVGWHRREKKGATTFTFLMGGIAVWSVEKAIQSGLTDFAWYQFWTDHAQIGASVTPTLAFAFALAYTGREHLMNRRRTLLLAVEPALILSLCWTNRHHGLMWQFTGEFRWNRFASAGLTHGPGFWVHTVYSYGLMLVAIGLVARFYVRSPTTYRRQAGLILAGSVVPLFGNTLWLAGSSPAPGLNPTQFLFTVTGLLFALGLFSYDLLDLAPIGRHTVVEELSDAVVTVDREGRIVDANPAARDLFAPDGEGLVGRTTGDVLPEYDALDDGGADDLVLDVDDSRRYFDARTTPLRDDAHAVVGHVLLLRDVTDRRRVEKRYQLLIENASDLITVVDADGTITYASPSTERVLGFQPRDAEGTSALSYIHPDDREEAGRRFAELVADSSSELSGEYRVRAANGEWRILESRGRNLLDDPVVAGIVVNSRDVTERRRRERRLQQQNEQLGEFASVISHDLRNPLAVASGYAQMLREEVDDERLDSVVDAHDRMDELLDDLLTLAREGRTVGETVPISLEAAASQAWSSVETAGATLNVEGDALVAADDTRLRQLLENLFRNTVEHAGVEATLRVGTTDAGFYVADDGPGVPSDSREEVFEAGTTGDDGGSGLGLTIVKRIADAHGWTVGVTESRAGGARFEFERVEWAEEP